MRIAQVGRLRWPVVHLHVDVGMQVGVPGSMALVVPDALQVAWDVYAPAATDGKVTSVGEIQLLEETSLGMGMPAVV